MLSGGGRGEKQVSKKDPSPSQVGDETFWKGKFWAWSGTVKKWCKVIAVCSKLNWHVQMNVAERGMKNLDEESWVM